MKQENQTRERPCSKEHFAPGHLEMIDHIRACGFTPRWGEGYTDYPESIDSMAYRLQSYPSEYGLQTTPEEQAIIDSFKYEVK